MIFKMASGQLVNTFQDLAQIHNKKGSQIEIAVLDFSKAFDTVPHDGLLSKHSTTSYTQSSP